MLKNENSVVGKQVVLKNERDNLLATLQVVGRIRENKVEFLGAALQVEEGISLHSIEIIELELASRLSNEVVVDTIYLH